MSDITETASMVYEDLLQCLVLEPHHEKMLEKRGFSEDEIDIGGWKTLPASTKSIVAKLAKKHGDDLGKVAGFYRQGGGDWALSASRCLVIPIRSPHGEISGIKLRSDNDKAIKKYFLLTSAKASGRSEDTCGTPAKPEPHFPAFMPDDPVDGVVRITEGEFKADIATLHSNVYTMSIPGVGFWSKILPHIREMKPNKVLLAFDSDKSDVHSTSVDSEEEYKVGKELSKLYTALKNEKFNVVIEDWDGQYGKGIDDVLTAGHEDKIFELTDHEADKFCSEKISGDLNDEWIYILKNKIFINTKTGAEFDKEQFDDLMISSSEEKGKPSANFMKDPSSRKFYQSIYMPSFPPVVEYLGHECYNTWREHPISAVDGDPSIFTDHIKYLLPNEDEANILLDWMAYQVQFPGRKMSWAIILQGQQRTGKSYIGFALRQILGDENIGLPSNEAIKGQFTKWQYGHSVIIIEEIMTTGRIDVMNKLKPMITENMATIRQMRTDEYTVPNVYNLIAFTNHRDAIKIESDDRRYCALFSEAKPKKSHEYESLFDWTRKNAGVIYGYLMNRDLSAFKPKGRAPFTLAKQEMVNLSHTVWQEFIIDGIEDSYTPFQSDIVTSKGITAYINKRFNLRLTTRTVANEIVTHGGGFVARMRVGNDNEAKRLMAVRNLDNWIQADKDIIKKAYLDGQDSNFDQFIDDGTKKDGRVCF